MIQDLNNTEISTVFYLFNDYIKDVDNALESGMRMKKMDLEIQTGTEEMSIHPIVMIKISPDEAEGVRTSHHYNTCKSVIAKLRPIVELIEEAEPEIKLKYDNNE